MVQTGKKNNMRSLICDCQKDGTDGKVVVLFLVFFFLNLEKTESSRRWAAQGKLYRRGETSYFSLHMVPQSTWPFHVN